MSVTALENIFTIIILSIFKITSLGKAMACCCGICLKAFPAQPGDALELLSNCVCAYECVCGGVRMHVCVCVHMHVGCVCVYTYRVYVCIDVHRYGERALLPCGDRAWNNPAFPEYTALLASIPCINQSGSSLAAFI